MPVGTMGVEGGEGMELQEFLARLNAGEYIPNDSEVHRHMHLVSQEALKVTAELNGGYHTPEEVRDYMARD